MDVRSLINQQETIILKAKQALRDAEAEYAKLKELRKDCDHKFEGVIKDYEQEGGTCILCGINEVHAACMKIGKKYKEKA